MLNIAIDGHAASGKSVIARGLAKKLGVSVFDTGALYRGLACEWDKQGRQNVDLQGIKAFLKNLTISVKFIDGVEHVYVNGTDHTPFLRLEKISYLSSLIAPYEEVREKVRFIQKNYAKNNDCVMEGRDIGSEILPNADYKFFITAPVEVRAQRRLEQERIKEPNIEFEKVLEDLKKRDYADENRKIAPLVICKDSIIINTTGKTPEESINDCLKYIKK